MLEGLAADLPVQVQALEDGVEAKVVTARIAELKADKEAALATLAEMDVEEIEAEEEDLAQRIERIPDLTQQLRAATQEVKRQVFEAFELRIEFDKAGRRIEISATVSEALAETFDKARGLPEEASAVASGDLSVTVSGIAGARYVSRGDARIVERLAA